MSNRHLASQASGAVIQNHCTSKNDRRPFGRRVRHRGRGLIVLLSVVVVSAVIVRASLLAEGQSPADQPAASEPACAELVDLAFEGNTTITASTTISGGTLVTPTGQSLTDLPGFCRVVGVSRPTSDSDIRFEVWLPSESWNGRFVSSGEGGYAGRLNYTRLGLDGGLDEWLRRGYATASTDTGHRSTDDSWAAGHPERVIDYAYRSKHLVDGGGEGFDRGLLRTGGHLCLLQLLLEWWTPGSHGSPAVPRRL